MEGHGDGRVPLGERGGPFGVAVAVWTGIERVDLRVRVPGLGRRRCTGHDESGDDRKDGWRVIHAFLLIFVVGSRPGYDNRWDQPATGWGPGSGERTEGRCGVE